MSVHPEDAMAYAEQRHEDLARIAKALEVLVEYVARIADGLGALLDGQASLPVRQTGAVIYREDRP